MDFFHALLIYCILLVVQIAGKPIPTNPRLFGCNIDWVSALPQFHLRINNTNLLNGFTASGLGATRYPGGNVGNCFNWTYARDNWADTTSNYCLTKVNNIKKKIELVEVLGKHSFGIDSAKRSWPKSIWPPVFDLNVLSASKEQSIRLVQSLYNQGIDMNAEDAILELGNELYFYNSYSYKYPNGTSYYEFTKDIVKKARSIFPNVKTAGVTWFNCLLGSEVECESNDRKKRWNVDLANAIAGDVGNNDLIYDSFTVHAYNIQPQLLAQTFPSGINNHDIWQTVIAAFPQASMMRAGTNIKKIFNNIKASNNLHMTEYGIPWFGMDKRDPPSNPSELAAYKWLSNKIRDSTLEAINTVTHVMTGIDSQGQFLTLLKHPCLKVDNPGKTPPAYAKSKGEIFKIDVLSSSHSDGYSLPKCGAQSQILKHISFLLNSYELMESVKITSASDLFLPIKILGLELNCLQSARFTNNNNDKNTLVVINRCPGKLTNIVLPNIATTKNNVKRSGKMVQYYSDNSTMGSNLWVDCPMDSTILPWKNGPLKPIIKSIQSNNVTFFPFSVSVIDFY